MAAITLSGESLAVKLSNGARPMARIAVRDSMGADQRKAVLVRVNVFERHLPTADLVAEVALCPVSSTVNVGMAILTVTANTSEHGMGVAFRASDCYVQASQWIASFAVIKVGFLADRLPGGGGVAIVTSNLHRAMRTKIGVRIGGVLWCAREGSRYLKQ